MAHILITGASSGIGAALALRYAAPDMRLSLHGRSGERLAEVAAKAKQKGAVVTVTTGDVADAAAMNTWVANMHRVEPLTLIIANAGISGGTSGIGDDDRRQVDRIFDVNIGGVLNVVTPAASVMAQRGAGQIAIVSSLAGFRGLSGSGAYAASKAAVRIYGEALRADLKPYGVRVNVICPGFIQTPMTDVNPFPMPFLMNAERAARIIQQGLARDKPRIAFPWRMYMVVSLLALLPVDLVIGLFRNRPKKPPFDAAH